MIKLEITLKEIEYNSLIRNILPKLLLSLSETEDKTAKLAQLLLGMEEMPDKMLEAALGVLPQGAKDDLLIGVISIYKEDLLKKINNLTKEQEIAAEVSDFKVESL